MKKVYKYRKELALKSGMFYLFYFYKKLILFDNQEYYIVIDPFGDKHLIPTVYYQSYLLKVKEYYLCKVDKINCLGQIFIEPPHPFFKEGESYAFTFLKRMQKKHKSGNVYTYLIFLSENGYEAFMKTDDFEPDDDFKTGYYFFKIEKISKGLVYLESFVNRK